MTTFEVNEHRFDPYKNFKFRLQWDGKYIAGFSKLSAMKRSTDVIDNKEVGNPGNIHKSPGRKAIEAITLERGVTHDMEFVKWTTGVLNLGTSPRGENTLQDFRRDMIIEVYNEAGQPAARYKIFRCWVSAFQQTSFDVNTNAVAIEHIELGNEGWELE